MEHLLKILFFIIYFIFLKHNPKNYDTKKKKYHIYSVINFSSNFRHINSSKEGDLIFFKCEGRIQDHAKLSDLVLIDDINNNFYQKNYLNFINKKCRPEDQMEDLLGKKY